MTHPITVLIFDFGDVPVKWDARNLYKRFFPDLRADDSFLEEIRFHEWNALQDAGRPFKEGIAELAKRFPHATLVAIQNLSRPMTDIGRKASRIR